MSSIYVHIPFCRTRCRYCAFYSGEPLHRIDPYVKAVATEVRLRASEAPAARPIDTVFFGGGTPSLLGPARLETLLRHIDDQLGLAADAEVTVECNPGCGEDFTDLRAAGITRCSLGVQSLDDATLARLGRTHTAEEARGAVTRAVASGFASVSADLLFGLTGVDPDHLGREATELATRGVDHLSVYSLEIHPGTSLAEDPGAAAEPDLEEAQWQALLVGTRAGEMPPYEVSNFARPGTECRHNQAYWEGRPYLGFGPGAHGYQPHKGLWGTRTWNKPGLDAYTAALHRGRLPPRGTESLGPREAVLEALFLWLRRPVPFPRALQAPRFGTLAATLSPHLETLVSQGDLESSEFIPTLQGMRRADGLALWLFERTNHPQPTP